MTATDVLRRLLDEHGVEWMPIAWNPKKETFYHTSNGVGFCADEYADGVKIYTDATITPAQAIAATLGATDAKPTQVESSGTCHDVWDVELTGRLRFQCSECGAVSLEITPRFCPTCGRKVVEPTTNDVDVEVEQ